jgi:hypothetical protein
MENVMSGLDRLKAQMKKLDESQQNLRGLPRETPAQILVKTSGQEKLSEVKRLMLRATGIIQQYRELSPGEYAVLTKLLFGLSPEEEEKLGREFFDYEPMEKFSKLLKERRTS